MSDDHDRLHSDAGHEHAHVHGHSHAHGHGSGHGHGHSHAPSAGGAFFLGTVLNLSFVAVEASYGFWSGSMALLADAGHNLSDVLGLLIAWGAASLTKSRPTERFTYGFRKSSVLAALFNAVILFVAVGAIIAGAVQRLKEPEPVPGTIVMIVAAIGILVNGATAWLFAGGQKHDINIRGAFLHMAADAAVSAGVVLAGFLTLRFGWLWLDPVTSLVIAAFILVSTWGLLKDSVSMSLDAVPPGIDPREVEDSLYRLPEVARVHDLHIWPMSTTEVALTCHLVTPAGHPGDAFLLRTAEMLKGRFSIGHITLQIEQEAPPNCNEHGFVRFERTKL